MRHETYQRLVQNLRRDGQLTSVPFAIRDGDAYLVLSGNHRVRAAIDAGITHADVMLTDDKLTEQRRVAIQLSHNALVGEDDPATLKELYDAIDSVDWRAYSGLDDRLLDLIESVDVGSLTEVSLDWMLVNLFFLPDELEQLRAALEEATSLASGEVWAARLADYDEFMAAMADAGSSHGVTRNQATPLRIILDVFNRHKTDLAEGWLAKDGTTRHGGRVPIASVLGTDMLPAQHAAALKRASERLAGQDVIPQAEPWRAIEHLARLGEQYEGTKKPAHPAEAE